MSDFLSLILLLFVLPPVLAAYFLVMNALFGVRAQRAKSAAQATPARSFWLGLINFVFFAVIALALLSVAESAGPFLRGLLTIPALLVLAFLAVILSLGLTAISSLIGERLFPEFPAWRQLLWGAVCLSLACAVPFVGWLLLLPYAGFLGIGAVILGFFQQAR